MLIASSKSSNVREFPFSRVVFDNITEYSFGAFDSTAAILSSSVKPQLRFLNCLSIARIYSKRFVGFSFSFISRSFSFFVLYTTIILSLGAYLVFSASINLYVRPPGHSSVVAEAILLSRPSLVKDMVRWAISRRFLLPSLYFFSS